MNIEELVNASLSLTAIAGLCYFYAKQYPEILVEEFRQEVFAIRDRMFDDAASGMLNFDDKAYSITRAVLNGVLHDADEITVGEMISWLMTRAHMDRHGYVMHSLIDDELQSMPKEKADAYRSYMRDLATKTMLLIRDRSILLSAVARVSLVSKWVSKKYARAEPIFQDRELAQGLATQHAYC